MIAALLVTSAATLLESAPFILAAVVLSPVSPRWSSRLAPYLGCGCGSGPSARSLPAAAAALLVFGPLVAGARLAAAIYMERVVRRSSCEHSEDSMLAQLAAVAPLAAISAIVPSFAGVLFSAHATPATQFMGGALAAFVLSPCAIGSIGLASALRTTLPGAAAALLCVGGIFDLRTWMRFPHRDEQHDALAYALAALACGLVAARSGGDLVHPKLALMLWPCAAACAMLAYRHRRECAARLRIAPLIMLAGAILAAPPPEYHATETSLSDAFAGERIDFSGMATQTGNATTLVRYAITCCRADAAPVVLRLERSLPHAHGWMHARGVLEQTRSGLRLRTDSLCSIPAPADPFVYR